MGVRAGLRGPEPGAAVPRQRRYEIDAYLGDTYAPLAEALGTGAGSGQPLRSSDFLREIDAKLPHTVTAGDKATPADVVRVVRDVEDADKVHFVRFIPHARDGQRHVTEANLAKTRKLMGQHIHDWCQRNNVSTGWTDVPVNTAMPEKAPVWPDYN